jgi:pyruvate formate lyase activating enzyme
MQESFLAGLLESCRSKRIETAVDTTGYAPWEVFERILPLADVFLYDIKLMDEAAHVAYTGVSNRPILENLRRLSESNARLVVRIPMIPGITDTTDNLKAIAHFVDGLDNIREVGLLPYNKMSEDKLYRFGMEPKLGTLPFHTDRELREKAIVFESRGYNVRIGG